MKKQRSILAWILALGLLAGCKAQVPPTETEPVTEPMTEATAPVVPDPPKPTEAPETEPTEPAAIAYPFFNVPTGFGITAQEEGITVYSAADGQDESQIRVETLPLADVLHYNRPDFLRSIANPADGKAIISTMETRTVNGREALFADYALKRGTVYSRCQTYLFPADQVYRFTFKDATPEGAWSEAFGAAAQSIRLLEEGQYAMADRTGLWWYDLGCGMQIYAAPDMIPEKLEGYRAALVGTDTVMLLFSESKAQVGEGFSLEEYAHAVTKANGLEECTLDAYGNLGTVFTQTDSTGAENFYYLTVKETPEDFWICQVTCPSELAAQNQQAFQRWCSNLMPIG